MTEASTCYIFAGVGSEYSLAPLAADFRRRGRTCVELDMARPQWRQMIDACLSASRRILVSSQHPFMNGHHYQVYYNTVLDMLNVPELQAMLAPIRSYYIPHDLLTPIKDSELAGLSLFDAALMPSDAWWYLSAYTRCENVGWIKASPAAAVHPLESGPRIAWLPSEIGAWSMRSSGAFEEAYRWLLSFAPLFKAPDFPGTEEMIDAATRHGCSVFPATEQSSALIDQADIVVSNGLSSICLEAALRGITTFCIDDGVVDRDYMREHWRAIEGVSLLNPEQAESLLRQWIDRGERPARRPSVIQPFDFDRAAAIIEGA